jgi:hypothetical protein
MLTNKDCIEKKLAILEERLQGAKEALKLQADEYERRLEILNHEAQQLKDMQTTYIPRETYEISHKSLEMKLENVQKLVYVGLGVVLAFEFLFEYLFKK